MDNKYIGHENQFYGVEEVRLVGGKGDGMRMLQVRNGAGLEFTVSVDRAADIVRLSFDAVNCGYFSPCGYVAPAYYEKEGNNFLRSFTAGFITTCGLEGTGNPCVDEGEAVPQHGTIHNTPAEHAYYYIENEEIHIKATIRDAQLFGRKLVLEREYVAPLGKNELYINDTIKNIGCEESPLAMLYHCNLGYPLLSEDTEINIPSVEVIPTGEHAASGLDMHQTMEKPQAGYQEMCYYHTLKGTAEITAHNKKLGKKLTMSYDTAELPYFCEWKVMGESEYVLGIEPGISRPYPRDRARRDGILSFIKPGEVRRQTLKFTFERD